MHITLTLALCSRCGGEPVVVGCSIKRTHWRECLSCGHYQDLGRDPEGMIE